VGMRLLLYRSMLISLFAMIDPESWIKMDAADFGNLNSRSAFVSV
jgi:hypothetical protein